MAGRVSAHNVDNAHKPSPLITTSSRECFAMRIPHEAVTAKGNRLRFCGPIFAYVGGRRETNER
jgi:hypothetical protein